ncbi:FecR family protein [Echinicola rosea]|uniref:Anti-sigma factor n=1 Tax=Echinicola rosea TaxID=1807691 RepID=A0ABQ1V0U3_9BACT|nr:FecR domain-containing protein [Echinicola rosea]GGF30863.1 anti-sigma factor [Echinicola rosea]
MVDKKQLNELLTRYLSGKTSDEENMLVDRWFEKTFSEEATESDQDLLIIKEEILDRIKANKDKVSTGKQFYINQLSLWWKATAAILVMLAGGYWIYTVHSPNEKWLTQSTGNGEQTSITLPDGSHVMINVASSIRYPEEFGDSSREIVLSGEAFFDVVSDPDRPFRVVTEKVSTEVLGTQFNINAYPSGTSQVSVFEGSVKVHAANDRDQSELLRVNQAVSIGNNGELLKHPVNLKMVGAWRKQISYLDGTSLNELATLIDRWYGYKVHFVPKALGDCAFSGKLKMGELEVLLNQIKFIKEIDWQITAENKIVFNGNPCN